MEKLKEAGVLWNNLGYHQRMVADYDAARRAYERALAMALTTDDSRAQAGLLSAMAAVPCLIKPF